MTPQHMRLIVFTLLFILSFSQVSFAETCAEILAGKTFATDGFEILKVPEPLTAAEAASLHKKLVFYLEMNESGRANEYVFILERSPLDPAFRPSGRNIVVSESPALRAIPEMRKLKAWVQHTQQHVDEKISHENLNVQMTSAVLTVGTKHEPMYSTGNRFLSLPKHNDGIYARVINTLLSETTPIHIDDQTLKPAARQSTLISGTERFYFNQMLATTHSSPRKTKTDRMLLRLSFSDPMLFFPNYFAPGTGNKELDISKLNPSVEEHGFQFLSEPIEITKSEAQQLVDSIREFYKIKERKIENVNVAVLDSPKYWERFQELHSDSVVQKYLLSIQHPVFEKIRSQVSRITQNMGEYFPEFQLCENIHVGLRIGFKEAPLYKNTIHDKSFEKFHQDRNYYRILAPLLGAPTEIFSNHFRKRIDLPVGRGTIMMGTLAQTEKIKAIFHRAPALADEDRVLLVVTCTEKNKPIVGIRF